MNDGNYFGKGDSFSYGQMKSFMGEHATGRKYGIKFTNTSVEDKVIGFSPALALGLASSVITGKVPGIDAYVTADSNTVLENLDDGVGTDGVVTANSLESQNPIELWLLHAAQNPFRIVSLSLNSDQKGQFSQKLEQKILSPFKKSDYELTVDFRDFVSADQFQSDRTDIKLLKYNSVLTMSVDSVFYFTLVANSTFELNMSIGAEANEAANLRRRGARALENIVRKYGKTQQG